MHDLFPFLKPSEKKFEIIVTGLSFNLTEGSGWLCSPFCPRTGMQYQHPKKVLPLTAFEPITCENLKVSIFCTDTKHSFEIKMTPWNLFGKKYLSQGNSPESKDYKQLYESKFNCEVTQDTLVLPAVQSGEISLCTG